MLIVEVRGNEVWRRVEGKGGGNALPTFVGPLPDGETALADCSGLAIDWGRRYGRAAAVGGEADNDCRWLSPA